MDKYAVIGGQHVIDSQSPFIHSAFAKQTQQTLMYQAIPILGDEVVLAQQLQKLAGEFKGLNITMPFKELAYRLLLKKGAKLSERARYAQAINTIKFENKEDWYGDNTDGLGLVADILNNLRWTISNKRILICGAGGAVRGILAPILEAEPQAVVIANRSPDKARALVKQFKALGKVAACDYQTIASTFDLVINAVATGYVPELSPDVFTTETCCYDLIYAKQLQKTEFLTWVSQQTFCKNRADGIGMLVEQAAESFRVWRGVFPDTQKVLEQLQHQ